MIQKNFEDISFADIQALIENSVGESKTLDYKRELPAGGDTPKRDFLADIASFANA